MPKLLHYMVELLPLTLMRSRVPKDALVELLRLELEGKSILDIGCGAGDFLLSCSRNIAHGALLGIDFFAPQIDVAERNLTFVRSDIVRFKVTSPFDVAISDNVFEHIVPQDVDTHLNSVRGALRRGGTVIILTPHRLFGPWDVTRTVDASHSGWLSARGTHINETTYSELANKLLAFGFNLRSISPKVRLGYRKSPARIPTQLFCHAERRPWLMRALQEMDKHYRYQAFEICIVATRC
jgi:2-polyprenyl-3-methyl-5-hydroxy-6-metoxy-1,4-benzoquinol methylase